MKLRAKPFRFRTSAGVQTDWVIYYYDFTGWNMLYRPRRGFVKFRSKADAEEYVRLYNACKKRRKK